MRKDEEKPYIELFYSRDTTPSDFKAYSTIVICLRR